jgi:hypothetical protein
LANIEYASSKEEGGRVGGFPFLGLTGGGAEYRKGFLSLPYDASGLLPLLKASDD